LDQEGNPTVREATMGSLLNMVDTNNRWVYQGTATTPPCKASVYWNVLTTVYPISEKHLSAAEKQLLRGEGGWLAQTGNWRQT